MIRKWTTKVKKMKEIRRWINDRGRKKGKKNKKEQEIRKREMRKEGDKSEEGMECEVGEKLESWGTIWREREKIKTENKGTLKMWKY